MTLEHVVRNALFPLFWSYELMKVCDLIGLLRFIRLSFSC